MHDNSFLSRSLALARQAPLSLVLLLLVSASLSIAVSVLAHSDRHQCASRSLTPLLQFYLFLFVAAPIPRPPRKSEKTYKTILSDGSTSGSKPLPSWLDNHAALKEMARKKQMPADEAYQISDPEIFMSVVVPAYNEEDRLGVMLEEAVDFLEQEYGDAHDEDGAARSTSTTAHIRSKGWEILIISDGSSDKTVETALNFARDHQLSRTTKLVHPTYIPSGSIRVVSLEENRGKGGAVTHGMRHVRGKYVVFADADGASKFSDLSKLIQGCQKVEDKAGRGVAIGSRAHLVGSEAVVKRSLLRNTLMHSFHLLLRLLTPPATSRIRDTQCGFKLFSRASLPYIIPFMHSESWIFDVEMLMLAESAGIPMAEVSVGWKEVKGSKLNVVWDSLGMAWGLAVLRGAWGVGVYRRD
ncbi:dolichyl-phosphate beta-glucosyltransferase [Cryomyces antarcticus]